MNSNVPARKKIVRMYLITLSLFIIIVFIGILFFIKDLKYLNSKLTVYNLLTSWIPSYFTVYLFLNLVGYVVFFRALYFNNLKESIKARKRLIALNISELVFPSAMEIFVIGMSHSSPLTVFSNTESLIIFFALAASIPAIFLIIASSVTKNKINISLKP